MNRIINIEQDADIRAENSQAYYILGMLLCWMERAEHIGSASDKRMVKYWKEKAGSLFKTKNVFSLEDEPGLPDENFKSLYQQYKDGDLWVKD